MTSSDKYIFRKAEKNDTSAVYALYKSVVGEEFCVWNDAYPDRLEIEGDLAANDLFVLVNGEKIIGAISIVPQNELDGFECFTSDGAEIARVVVAKEHRARGLSYKMVSEIEKKLLGRGIKAIHLSVAKTNIPAYKTYIKAGFKTVGEAEIYGGDYYLMEKQIKGIYGEKREYIAEKMFSYMLDLMDPKKDITVTTYRADVHAGIPARMFYKKMGFTEGKLKEEFGSPVQEFVLKR